LDKILADTGLYSRREVAVLISQGRVVVSGELAKSGACKYDPGAVDIKIDGNTVNYTKFHYIVMNKPAGYISSTFDRNERTVLELLDDKYTKLGIFPVGRLDKDAEGLLLLTNDGDFAHRITSPSKNVKKRYFVVFDGEVTDNDIMTFKQGLVLADGTRCLPAKLEATEGGAFVTVVEGKYHQVKRMMVAIGKPVLYLKRISIGGMILDEMLKTGEFRELTSDDCKSIILDKYGQSKKNSYKK